jgi:hypothetical protein
MDTNGLPKSKIAAEFEIDPMTLGRFLKSGKVIDANRQKLEEGLARVGAWAVNDTQNKASDIVLSDKVIAALEFLLAAARQHDSARSGG